MTPVFRSSDHGSQRFALAPAPEGAGIRTAEEWISLVRVLILLTLIPALWFGIIPIVHPALNAIIVLLGGYVILLAIGPRWLPGLRRADLVIVLDIFVVTLVVIISGSLNSPFVYLYYLTILEAAGRLNLRQALAASLAMTAIIILLWIHAGHIADLESTGFRLGAFIAGGFLLALLLGILAQEYRAARERLEGLQFDNDLSARLSGELRVEGVLETLLQVFLEAAQLRNGVAYLCDAKGTPRLAATRGVVWGRNADPHPVKRGLEHVLEVQSTRDERGLGLFGGLRDCHILAYVGAAPHHAGEAIQERLSQERIMPDIPIDGHIPGMHARDKPKGRIHHQRLKPVVLSGAGQHLEQLHLGPWLEFAFRGMVIQLDNRGNCLLGTRGARQDQDGEERRAEKEEIETP